MNIEQKPFEMECYSLRVVGENHEIIHQKSSEIHKHEVQQGYQILSKNDFGKVKKRVNVGIFNKKTNFVVGEKNSLLFWDNTSREITSKPISEILIDKSRYFMIYDLSFMADLNNFNIVIQHKSDNKKIEIKLDNTFGKDIGSFLKIFDPTIEIPEEFDILRSLIKIESGKLSINKQVLLNSNPDFLLGILEGYLKDSKHFQLKPNINIYNFTYILNLLGAQYSIRTVDVNEKHIRFKLPIFLKGISTLNDIYFRNYKYFFDEDKELKIKKDIINILPDVEHPDFFGMVNSGLIEMIPIRDLVFIPLEEPTIMYDLTMTDPNATNYSLPGMPLAKNSDGDVLGVVAIHTKDAAEECTRKFSTELKENFLNLATGQVANHGVKLDSQLGLYAGTK